MSGPHTILLAIDTAGSGCSAVMSRGDTIIGSETRPLRHGHAEVLLPMIARVVAITGIVPGDIDAVAVTVGPGGFTGIRVGLAAAHGIAIAAKAQLVGVTGFEAVVAALSPGQADAAPLLVALDSRRAELYVQLFSSSLESLGDPAMVPPDRLPDYVGDYTGQTSGAVAVAGDAAGAAVALLQNRFSPSIIRDSAPGAAGVARAARHRLRRGAIVGPTRPLYLRPPDVTLPKRPVATSIG